MREIRMLRSMWRGLETESRLGLLGHERGNPGHRQDRDLRTTAPALDPTRLVPGGVLLVGVHEALPEPAALPHCAAAPGLYRAPNRSPA